MKCDCKDKDQCFILGCVAFYPLCMHSEMSTEYAPFRPLFHPRKSYPAIVCTNKGAILVAWRTVETQTFTSTSPLFGLTNMPTHNDDDYSFAPFSTTAPMTKRLAPANIESPSEFRSRYAADESSDAAYKKDLQNRRFQLGKKRALLVLIFVICTLVAGMVLRVYSFFNVTFGFKSKFITSSKQSVDLARKESFGFFTDLSVDEWMAMKDETKSVRDAQDALTAETSQILSQSGANIDSNAFWMNYWKVDLTCKNEMKIGGRWICDPKRVITLADEYNQFKKKNQQENDCLVYISGGNDLEFGNHFLDYSIARMMEMHAGQATTGSLCEVHVFNPNAPVRGLFQELITTLSSTQQPCSNISL